MLFRLSVATLLAASISLAAGDLAAVAEAPAPLRAPTAEQPQNSQGRLEAILELVVAGGAGSPPDANLLRRLAEEAVVAESAAGRGSSNGAAAALPSVDSQALLQFMNLFMQGVGDLANQGSVILGATTTTPPPLQQVMKGFLSLLEGLQQFQSAGSSVFNMGAAAFAPAAKADAVAE